MELVNRTPFAVVPLVFLHEGLETLLLVVKGTFAIERQLPRAEAEPKEQEASARPEAAAKAEPKKERTPRLDWAGLLRKSLALDVFVCGRCGGRRQVLAYLMAPSGVCAI